MIQPLRNKNIRIRFRLCVAAVFILSLAACKKENEEALIKKQGGNVCDTTNVTYSADVSSILQSNCYSCHSTSSGIINVNVNFEGYSNVKMQVDNNNLISAITHAPGYTPMPYNLPKLSDCNINIIRAWINGGAPNN